MSNKLTSAVVNSGDIVKLTPVIRQVYSKEIEFKALPLLKFAQLATLKTELGVSPGLSIEMMTYDNLALGGALTEGTDMETKALSASTKQIAVTEMGNAIAVSELLLRSASDDVLMSAARLLGNDYAKVIDLMLRDAALTTTNVKYGYSGGTAAASRATISSAHKFSTAVVKDAVEVLSTGDAPTIGDSYICILHPHQARCLRDDSAWINASSYGAPTQLFNGEVGKYENVRFIETTNMPILTGAGASSADVYRALVLAADEFGWATSLPVEMRDNGTQDFGRKHGLAWYAITGAGLLNASRGCVIETA